MQGAKKIFLKLLHIFGLTEKEFHIFDWWSLGHRHTEVAPPRERHNS